MSQTSEQDHTPQLGDVVCVATHPVDLADGRSLEPGEKAEGIDVAEPHNAALVDSGNLIVSQSKQAPAKPQAVDTTNTTAPQPTTPAQGA